MHKTIRSVDVYYEKYGEGIPIIMIHGFAPDSQLMIGCMEPVFDKEARSHAYMWICLEWGKPRITTQFKMLTMYSRFY